MWFLRPDRITVWNHPEVRRRLWWYRQVMLDEKPAKFMVCKRIPVKANLREASEEELWKLHDSASKEFHTLLAKVREGKVDVKLMPEASPSLLELKAELSKRMLEHCCFCEHRCGVNRMAGERGRCRLDYRTYVASWFHHWGEEAPLLGRGGSGTIFFNSCNFRCVFCQNYDISQEWSPQWSRASQVDARKLAKIEAALRLDGAANINFVGGDPTPNLHTILESLLYLEENVPLLWNSNMYCSIETMKLLADIIDIWLPDFKYGNDSCAERLSKVQRYFEVVSRNHKIAHESGDMIIRHLVLPNHVECCTKPVLKWISENCPNALVNVMAQYRPEYLVARNPRDYPDISRRPTAEEMRAAYSYAKSLGICYEPVS
ncbi:MAG: pyruvate formate lyase-activating protein [Thermoproteota archaeon]|nr:MAG: pyruvate formate lyase-activating protein [Candidatus Korarchaeota archaeon]